MKLVSLRVQEPRRNEKFETVGWDSRPILVHPSNISMVCEAPEVGKTVVHLAGGQRVIVAESVPEVSRAVEKASTLYMRAGRLVQEWPTWTLWIPVLAAAGYSAVRIVEGLVR